MKINKISLLFVLSGAFLLGSCGPEAGSGDSSAIAPNSSTSASTTTGSGTSTSSSGGTSSSPSPVDYGFNDDIDVTAEDETTFAINSDDAPEGFTYDKATNSYTITAAGTYSCSGNLIEGQLIVNAPDSDVEIDLEGVIIYNSTNSPIYIIDGDNVDISAKKGSENKIYDVRDVNIDEDSTLGGAAIYAECDLTIKGKGYLKVISNYNNGIHTKDDLEIKNLTLDVKAVNNAIKGNDSLDINGATITAVSSGGDAVKTNSTDTNKNAEQRGVVTILDGSTLNLYSAQDGIDSASDVVISGGTVNIYTDKYSSYTADGTTTSQSNLYLRLPQSVYSKNYKYSAYFTDSEGNGTWDNLEFYKSASGNTGGPNGGQGGGPGGGQGGGTTYYYYKVSKPSSATSVVFYAYNSSQTQGQSSSYVAKSTVNTTIPTSGDTYQVTQIYGTTIVNGGWSSFASSSGTDSLDYSCKGIKADNEINISGGTINITARDDGIHCNNDNVLESTNANGLGNINISGGTITIATDDDGVKADQDLVVSGGTISVTKSYEAYEANRVLIEGGESTLYASDDGINATETGSYTPLVQISGGLSDVTVPSGDTDTIDSNGDFKMTGGTAILRNGSTGGYQPQTGGTLDVDGNISVTGGTFIAIGQIGEKVSDSTYNTSTSLSAGSYALIDSSSAEIATWDLASTYKAYMIWSDQFVSGNKYYVTRGGSNVITISK